MATFEQLMKQVANLQAENTNLRRELRDNSSHISKLETEACSMKDVLTHLHTAIQDDDSPVADDSHNELHSFTAETEDNSMQEPPALDHNSNASTDDAVDPNWLQTQTRNLTNTQSHQSPTSQAATQQNIIVNSDPNLNELPSQDEDRTPDAPEPVQGQTQGQKVSHESSPTEEAETPTKKRSGGEKDLYSYFQELDSERKTLSQELENEERQRQLYHDQLAGIQRQLDQLSTADQRSAQTDGARRQLDYERQRLLDMMHGKLGSEQEMTSRHTARLQRVRRIEAEMLRVQQLHKEAKTQSNEKSFSFQDGVLVDSAAPLGSQLPVNNQASGGDHINTSSAGIFIGGKHITLGTQTPTDNVTPSNQQTVSVATETTQHDDKSGGDFANQNLATLYHGSWPIKQGSESDISVSALGVNQDTASVMSFRTNNTSSTNQQPASGEHMLAGYGGGRGGVGGVVVPQPYPQAQQPLQPQPQHLGTKVEMVYGLLSMLGTHDKDDMSRTLLAMSSSQDSCIAMRQSGCLPLLIQLLHGSDSENGLLGKTRGSKAARARASAALHNIVHSHPDDKRGRREARVLRLLEQIRAHWDQLREGREEGGDATRTDARADMDHHPGPAIAALMKLSFDEEHRHAICTLGGLQAIAELLLIDQEVNGNTVEQYNITMRRYACMALTNLTFGDGTNKALLCSMKQCMCALVAQLQSPNEDLRQVAASVLRNLSWRADLASKKILREVGTVPGLMMASMEVDKESTLKSVLSALWNLSAHCSENKADICAVSGSLSFLVTTLTYKSPTKTLSIIENGGGILRNISSHIAVREEYRQILRHHGCLHILLKHLRSPSLTIVSNACGTLWNLSARCAEDQRALWEMGAVGMLKNLVTSKHKMISMGSAAALKNLLNAKQSLGLENEKLFNTNKPGLHIRKQRALEAELDPNLAETCDNMESPTDSPTHTNKRHDVRNNKLKLMYPENAGVYPMTYSHQGPLQGHATSHMLTSNDGTSYLHHQASLPNRPVSRSGSQDSVGSVHSDISHDRTRLMLYKTSKMLEQRQNGALSPYRNNSANRSRSGSRDRSHGDHPNRIMKVMNEVAKHSGLDANGHLVRGDLGAQFSLKESHSADNTPAVARRSTNASFHEMPTKSARYNGKASAGYDYNLSLSSQSNGKHVDVASLSRNMEKLHLSLKEATSDVNNDEEQPVNYSMKYSNNQNVPTTQASKPFAASFNSAFRPNQPQVNNYVSFNPSAGIVHGGKHMQRMARDNTRAQNMTTSATNGGSHWNNSEVTPTDEQPTNFSARYAERVDDTAHEDEPVNYSTRYSERTDESAPKDVTSYRSQNGPSTQNRHFQQHISSMDDDTVKTFCTEGTPLNFLSTATSLTDLSKIDEHSSETPDSNTNSANNKTKPVTDLDASRDETTNYSSRDAEMEHKSVAESYSTERDTNSTVVDLSRNATDQAKSNANQKTPPSDKGSQPHSQVPSLYSYNDNSSVSASPSEKPTKYCTEGTPVCFSRVSSLSSLHSSDGNESHPHGNKSADLTLQAIDENQSLDTSALNHTLKDGGANDSLLQHRNKANDSGSSAHKTVTFDNNYQIQETPLMFSRCSSIGSLSSFDVHSVHSSVMSEYSRRTSGIVSPSELPDSPSDTMPPSPSRRKSPPPIQPDFNNTATPVNKTSAQQSQPVAPPLPPPLKAMIAQKAMRLHTTSAHQPQTVAESTKAYAEEECPEFSCASSLSALTIEDEPTILKEANLKRIPLGEEDGMSEKHSDKQSDKTGSKGSPVNETIEEINEEDLKGAEAKEKGSLDEDDHGDFDDDDDNSSVSEGEENLLQELVIFGMPPSSKKKLHKSASDNTLKNKGQPIPQKHMSSGGIPRSATTPQHLNISLNNTPDSSSSSLVQHMNSRQRLAFHQSQPRTVHTGANQRPVQHSVSSVIPRVNQSALPRAQTNPLASKNAEFPGGYDSPKKYATEGTPLEFSRATSLSDLSVDFLEESGMEKKDKEKPVKPENAHDSDKSDNSSLFDSGDDEDLLSEAIEAAMPKSKKQTKAVPNVNAQPRKPVAKIPVPQSNMRYQSNMAARGHVTKPPNLSGYGQNVEPMPFNDVVKSYAVEGTPLNFSRAESLSDLSDINSLCDGKSVSGGNIKEIETGTKMRHKSVTDPMISVPVDPAVLKRKPEEDVIEGYGEKDTLKSYAVEDTPYNFSRRTSLSGLSIPHSDDFDDDSHNQTSSTNKADVTVIPKQPELPASSHNNDDAVKTYAVEDTPYNFSRRTSLSDLSDAEEVEEKQTQKQAPIIEHRDFHAAEDGIRTYAVEDTPYNFSRRTSLSALSIPDDLPKPAEITEDAHEDDADISGQSSGDTTQNVTVFISKPENLPPVPTGYDSPRVYGMEGTPLNFSRNDSLSSLSCDEGGEDGNRSTQSVGSNRSTPAKQSGLRKPGIQSPAIARLRTPQKLFKHPPTMHSTPMPNKSAGQSPQQPAVVSGENPLTYAVEDTPAVFSRNSSLSSLESAEHEGMAHHSNSSAENEALLQAGAKEKDTLKLADSPLSKHSYNSSLSSLSVESLSFEPSESESALLEECISSAMPKSTKKMKRKDSLSRLARPSPSGSSRHNTPTHPPHRPAHPDTLQLTAEQSKPATNETTPTDEHERPAPVSAGIRGLEGASAEQEHTENVNNNNIIGSPKREMKEFSAPALNDEKKENKEQTNEKKIKSEDFDAHTLAETFADLEHQFAELGMGHNGDVVKNTVMTTSASSKHTYNMESSTEEDSRISQISNATKDLGMEAKYMVDIIQREKETAPSDQSTDSLEASSNKPHESNDFVMPDIMKESFPEMTSSLISNITTPDKEAIPEMLSVLEYDDTKNTSHASSTGAHSSVSENSGNITVIARREPPQTIPERGEEASLRKEEALNTDPLDITAEEAKALEENANIVLSCMAANQMTCSSVSDDAFIDQECLSLVSSGPCDTGSELSYSNLTFSSGHREPRDNLDSVTTQESESTICRTPSAREDEEPARQGPRISKPSNKPQVDSQENSPKGIRGGKKTIKGRPPPASGNRTASPSSWKSPESKVISPKVQAGKKPMAKTPPPNVTKRAPPSLKDQNKGVVSQRKSGIPANGKQRQSPVAQKEQSTPSPRGLKKPATIKTPPQISPKPTVSNQSTRKTKPQMASPTSPLQRVRADSGDFSGEMPGGLVKQGTFVKEDSSYSLASSDANTVQYRTPTGSNRNSCEIPSNRSSVDLSSCSRASTDIKYSKSAGEFRNGRSRPTSKGSEGKLSPTKSEKSDHGCFTVEGYGGAWEESSFTVCDYTGAWEDVRKRRRSGESGSGSCTDTPPSHRRSLVLDPIEGIIEDSYNTDVFQPDPVNEQPTQAPQLKQISPRQIPKPSQIAKPTTSRLPQSRLPGPRTSNGLPKTGSSSSLARSSSGGSVSSFGRSSPRSSFGKPATPPRASSLDQPNGRVRSGTPPNRSTTPTSRSGTPTSRSGTPTSHGYSRIGRPISPLLKQNNGTPQAKPSVVTKRSPYGQQTQVTLRKNSIDSNASSKPSAPQAKKSGVAKPAVAAKPTVTAKPPTPAAPAPQKKPSKIAGFLRKGKGKDSAKGQARAEAQSSLMQTSLVRSGTYEKLDTDASADSKTTPNIDEEARKAKEKRAAKVKQWRQTYTVKTAGSDHEGDLSSAFGSAGDYVGSSQNDISAASSGDLTSGQEDGATGKKSRIRRSGLFRRSKTKDKDEETKKEKSDQPKRRFGLWRRDSAEKTEKNEDSSPTADIVNSPNGDVFPPPKDITPTQVVPPFNYVPVCKPNYDVTEKTPEELADDIAMPPPPQLPPSSMTKTEMLMARRRQANQNGTSGSEVSLENEEVKKQSFLVTTV